MRTAIESHRGNQRRIALICHSLGGLVARRYLVDEIKHSRVIRVTKLLMYTSPNSGSDLANLETVLPWRHKQFIQLLKRADFLESLNQDWRLLGLDDLVHVRYVLGGLDRVVDEQGAEDYWGRDNCDVVVDADHRSLVKPAGTETTSYLLARNLLLEEALPSKQTVDELRSQIRSARSVGEIQHLEMELSQVTPEFSDEELAALGELIQNELEKKKADLPAGTVTTDDIVKVVEIIIKIVWRFAYFVAIFVGWRIIIH